jgi:DegV family protein with EDD domain
VGVISLSYITGGNVYKSFNNVDDEPIKKFYEFIRNKDNITTTCANTEDFINAFTIELEKGNDILYIGFSSGLSATYQTGVNAIKILKEKYPERKIYAVDSLLASLGQVLLVYYACLEKQEGKSIEEVYKFACNTKMSVNSLFTVKTLSYLAKGGRISKLTYALGTVTDIKPIMYVNEQGKLVSSGKVMGRKRSLIALADKVAKTIIAPETQTIFISHGDCLEDAKKLAELIRQRVPVINFVYNYVDPVIGVHSGPDTLAVFFIGLSRIPSGSVAPVKNDFAGSNI